MKKIIKNTLITLLFFITVLTIKNSNIKAATYGHYTYKENNDGTITITKYDGTAANNIEIPSMINGKKVTIIGDYAFDRCSGLTGDLVIPNSVISIGDVAFQGCSGLTGNLVIPNSVKSIGEYAFNICSGFTGNLVIPDSVTSIGDGAFSRCSGFTGNLVIPDSVTSIGKNAFFNCKGLTNFYVGQNNVNYSSLNGILYSKDKSKIIQCLAGKTGNLVIPNSVTSIGLSAFSGCSGLTGNLVIPDSVTSIGASAFEDCSGLTGNLVIPDSVTSIGASAFRGCSGFNGNLTIGKSVTSIGNTAFDGCYGFTGNLVIPDSVTSIGYWAFVNCEGLTNFYVGQNNVNYSSLNGILYSKDKSKIIQCLAGKTGNLVIPDSVTSIGASAFEDCSGLTGNLVIPDSVTSIGEDAFRGCSGFTGNLTISNSVTSIGENTFNGCSGFNGSLIIPDSVTNIGEMAFYCCRGFNGNLTIPNGVINIGEDAFGHCEGFTGSLVIPESVTNIGSRAFNGCSGLSEIIVNDNNQNYCSVDGILYNKEKNKVIQCPEKTKGYINILNSVTSIGEYAFGCCSNLTGKLILPDSITSIGSSAFLWCHGFTGNLVIPDSVTSIGNMAFEGCYGFTGNLVIPDSVTSIGNMAFNSCSNLDKIIFVDNAPAIYLYTFEQNLYKIYYRKGTTGFTSENNWPTGQLVEYEESLKNDEYVVNYLASGNDREKIELNDILSELVTPEYEVADTSVATVEQNGKIGYINPLKNGTTEVTVKLKYSDSVVRTLKANVTVDIKVTNLNLDKTSYSFSSDKKGQIVQLNATVLPENANNRVLNWTSSNTNIATVDSTGKVTTAGNGGECVITATTTDGTNISATCNIKVPKMVKEIMLNKTSYTFTDSTPLQLIATILPENATNKEITWESTNPSIVVVDENGVVRPIANKGGGMIIAKAKDGSGKTATCNITIDMPDKYISLNKSECTLKRIGESTNLTARIYPSSMSQEVNWTSSNTNIATVDSTGKVTAVGLGTCEIIATSKVDSSLKASCNITVEEIKVTSITLNKTSYTFTDRTPLQLVATILPENATNKEVTWETTTPGTLSVDSTGKVTPTTNQGGGMIIARAKDGSGKVATCNITINIGGSATYKKGDINKDGKVTVMDVRYGLKALTKGTITDEEIQIGDVNGDNKFSVMDARKILRYIVGKISTLD